MFGAFSFRNTHLTRLQGSTMGTTWSVQVLTRRPAAAERLRERITARLAEITAGMSVHRPNSELSRFNQHVDGTPFAMSPELFHVFQHAMQISQASGGASDITVAAAMRAYGFGSGTFPAALPDDAEVRRLLQGVGYQLLNLDPQARTVTKLQPDLQCDLSGIAKGYAVDALAKLVASECNADNYLVEIGGELRAKGCNAQRRPWRIAITPPAGDGGAVAPRCVELHDESIATSGDYEVYFFKDGKRISHTIDPRSGRPVDNGVASVTVIAPNCEQADAWATALAVLGVREGRELAEAQSLPALFITRTADGAFTETMTSAFRKCVA